MLLSILNIATIQAKCFSNSNQAILKSGGTIYSDNGMYFLTIAASDGNLILYDLYKPAGNRAIWNAGIHLKSPDNETLQFYNGVLSRWGIESYWDKWSGEHKVSNERWYSHLYNNSSGGSVFCIQNDGNLVVYKGSKVLWASNSEQKFYHFMPVGVGSVNISACGTSTTQSSFEQGWLDNACSQNTEKDNVIVTFSGTSNRCYLTYKDKTLMADKCDNDSVVIKTKGDKFLFLCQQKSPGDQSCSWVTTQKLSATTMLSSSLYN